LIDDWKEKNPAHVGKEDMFEGPNAPKKKRRNQTPAGREQDYDVKNDMNAPTSRPTAPRSPSTPALETEND